MRTFERYFFTELLANLLATLSVLSIVVIGNLLSKLLENVSEGRYPLDVIAPLLIYGTLNSLVFLLPFSAMLAVMLTMGRYYHDNEASAAFSLGISYARICGVLMQLAVPLTLLMFVLVMKVLPEIERQYELIKEMGKQRGDVTMVTAGRFFSPRDDTILFVEDYDRAAGRLSNIFIAHLSPEYTMIETAAYGEQKLDENHVKRLHLYEGYRYGGTPGQTDYRVSEYREHTVHLPARLPRLPGDNPEAMTFGALLASNQVEAKAELQWRFAAVISVPALVLLAFPLARVAPRRGRNARTAVAILVFLVYENLAIFVTNQVESGDLPVFPGVWWIPALAFAATTVLLARRSVVHVFLSGFRR